ncbi:alpha/beta fold hydrolase [Parapedobacter deserti]|uniref:Alpha/beta fold hydrolase n=1 Tax=Parapedobacter deserti TaxID=1912957 RepID=A0ABV7JD93_9SPHI
MKTLRKIMTCLLIGMASHYVVAQDIPYGSNPEAGHYLNVGDANIYYEVYGEGQPLVMLHGGVYGYIDEFTPLIVKLADHFQVICIGIRGHGKSEIGNTPYSYQQRADDAYQVIRAVTQDSVIVIGFSDGGHSALKLAALYPQTVKKVVAMGIGDKPKDREENQFNYTAESLMASDSTFFAGRLKLMPEPERWNESLSMLSDMYNNEYMSKETFEKIQCPVLLMNGDNDGYNTLDAFIQCSKYLSQAQVAVIPGCHHVIFFCNFPAVWAGLAPFLGLQHP